MRSCWRQRSCHAMTIVLLMGVCGSVMAESRILVFDLTSKDQGAGLQLVTSPTRVSCVPIDYVVRDSTGKQRLWNALSVARPNKTLSDNDGVAAKRRADLLKAVPDFADASSLRWMSHRGDTLHIFVFTDPGAQPKVSANEKERASQFSTDMATLVKFIAAGGFGPAGASNRLQPAELSYYTMRLQNVRATLEVDARAPQGEAGGTSKDEDPNGKASSPSAKKPSTSNPDTTRAQAQLVTGPAEHWFLSVNLPLTKLSGIALNDSGVGVPKEKPSSFLIGVNFLLGDLLSLGRGHTSPVGWLSGVGAGFVVEASSHPLESLGFIGSYRFAARGMYGFELDTLSPFVGAEKTKSESKSTDGTVHTKDVYKFVFGVSFNLDKALSWFGNGSGTSK